LAQPFKKVEKQPKYNALNTYNMIAYITAFSFGLWSFGTLLQTPILFLFRILGYHYYIIRKNDEKTRALAKILQTTTYNSITLFQHDNFYPSGYFINSKCVGCYDYSSSFDSIGSTIHIIATPKYIQTFMRMETQKVFITPKTITMFSRAGSYMGLFYSRLNIDIQGLDPIGAQSDVVDNICERFAEKRRGVFFIHGVGGAGKSTIGLLVAGRLNGTLCHTFNPSEPGDTLENMLRDSEPTEDKPTIIIFEEANVMIRAVHEGTIQKHKNVTTCVHNKSTYNSFMDDLILYRNVMIIMTSNEDKATIDKLDPCYLRKGRVNAYFTMMDTLDNEI